MDTQFKTRLLPCFLNDLLNFFFCFLYNFFNMCRMNSAIKDQFLH